MGTHEAAETNEEVRWRERNRRLWRFLVFAPYAAFLPALILIPLRGQVSDSVAIALGIASLVLLTAYAVIGGTGIYRVNRDRWRMTQDKSR